MSHAVNQAAVSNRDDSRYLFVKQLTIRHIPDSESLNFFIAEYEKTKKEITDNYKVKLWSFFEFVQLFMSRTNDNYANLFSLGQQSVKSISSSIQP